MIGLNREPAECNSTFSLFEILTGKYAGSELVTLSSSNEALYHSIGAHLLRLLNARQGFLQHLPDYGLPDVTEIYQGLPYSINILLEAIKTTIEKYEPRLRNVRVINKSLSEVDPILYLIISGTINTGTPLQFDAYFLSGGNAKIAGIT